MQTKHKKKIILSEWQVLHLINEALSPTLYHWTSIAAAYKIFTSNTMFCQSSLAGGGADDMSNKYKFYISMARNRTNKEGFSTNYSHDSARIEFDGDRLNQNFAGNSVNYWGAGDLYNKWTYMRHATGVENGDNFRYEEIDTLPQGAVAKNRDTFPHNPTPNSPDFIKVGKHYFQKINDKRNVEKQIGFEYKPINQIPEGDVPKEIKSYDFKYPTEFSPEYALFNGKVYQKERSIPTGIQQHHENEMEDRLFTNKPVIDNVRQYIKRIDLIVEDFGSLPDKLKRIVYNFALRSQICYIYDNQKDFNHQTDNTINETIKNLDHAYEKFGETLNDNRDGCNIDILARFMNLITLGVQDVNQKNKLIANYLKNGGLEKEIRPVIKKQREVWGNVDMLIDNISIDIQNISKSPTENGQKTLEFITKFFIKKGWKSWRDAAMKIKAELNPNEWENIDTSVKKTRTLLTVNSYTFDVTDDKDTDFWYIFRLDDLQDRYYFIENLIDNLNYATNGNWEHDGEWINNIRDKNKLKFQKYLQSLAHKQVTLSQMFGLFNKIGYTIEQFQSDFGYEMQYNQETFDYWSYKWSHVMVPYKSKHEYNSDARDEYANIIYSKSDEK